MCDGGEDLHFRVIPVDRSAPDSPLPNKDLSKHISLKF